MHNSSNNLNIDFGIVTKYFSDRGFGFVRGLIIEINSEFFFHIKTIKKTNQKIYDMLIDNSFKEELHFWFETEVTPKGTQVSTVLSPEQARRVLIADPRKIIEKVESHWSNIEHPKPSWLDVVTSDLVGRDRTDELNLERERLESEEQKKRELERKERAAQAAIAEEKFLQQYNIKIIQERIEEEEFTNLVDEIRKLGFTKSKDVSNYIIYNRLGYKYQNISGFLEMELNGRNWNFNGGFPSHIYARLCKCLGLKNEGSKARAVNFVSFKDADVKKLTR